MLLSNFVSIKQKKPTHKHKSRPSHFTYILALHAVLLTVIYFVQSIIKNPDGIDTDFI